MRHPRISVVPWRGITIARRPGTGRIGIGIRAAVFLFRFALVGLLFTLRDLLTLIRAIVLRRWRLTGSWGSGERSCSRSVAGSRALGCRECAC